jgi:hypothetical protein
MRRCGNGRRRKILPPSRVDLIEQIDENHFVPTNESTNMLEPDQWDPVLGSVTGTVYRGTERISSNALLNLLEVGPDPIIRQKVGKRLVSHMRRLLWSGPRGMRIPGTTGTVQGYWRRPGQLPRPHTAGMPVAGEFCDDIGLSEDLPAALEQVTRQGLKKLSQILRVPLDRLMET